MSERAWRLLVTEPTDGATNMAIDEALWRGRQAGGSPPTLRFFAWAPPTVSLGYGQPLGRDVDEAAQRHYLGGLRTGKSRHHIARELALSEEATTIGLPLRGDENAATCLGMNGLFTFD